MKDDFQSLGEKFIVSKWATKFINQDGNTQIEWTPKGLERLKSLYQAFEELGDEPIEIAELALLRGYVFMEAKRQGWPSEF